MSEIPRPSTYVSMTIAGGIRASAARTPDKPALGLGERRFSYTELVQRINRVANGARGGLGLGGGDRAAILAPNCLEIVELLCGLADVGITAVLINPRLTAPEVEYILADSGARVLFVHASLSDLARDLDVPTLEKTFVLGSNYEDWLARGASSTPSTTSVEEWRPFVMHYTAGTTGKPKGVLVSHRSRVLTFFGMAVEYGCYGPNDSAVAIAPMYHGAGLAFALAPIFFGGYCEIMPRFNPEQALRYLAKGGYSNTFLVPTHFNAIFQLEQKILDENRNSPTLRTIVANAAPLPQATKQRIVDYFGEGILHETYGSTEGGIVCNLRPPDQLRKEQCVGLPFPYTQVRLLDQEHRDVPQGEVGELFSYSPYLFNGYWQRPEATVEALYDGWLTVGDLARRDDEGFLYLVDRKKDVIISGGVNIYPREIEERLQQHPEVVEVAVVGVPDEHWGEAVKAYVVLRRGCQDVDAQTLHAHCEGSLARYKLPKSFVFVDSLPRNAAGKILKRELRTRHDHAHDR